MIRLFSADLNATILWNVTSPHSIQRNVVELDKLAGIDSDCGRECCGQKANIFPAEIIRQHHFGNPTDCWSGHAAAALCMTMLIYRLNRMITWRLCNGENITTGNEPLCFSLSFFFPFSLSDDTSKQTKKPNEIEPALLFAKTQNYEETYFDEKCGD